MVKLEVDWNYTPSNDRRVWGRLSGRYLSKFYFNNTLEVYISTRNRDYNGIIVDLSAGGMLVFTEWLIKETSVKVSFLAGVKRIITLADVKRQKILDNGYEYGVRFTSLKDDDRAFLNDLFVSKVLQQWR